MGSRLLLRIGLAAVILFGMVAGVGPGSVSAADTGPDSRSVERLYLAYFLRPPDTAGLTYWENQRAGGMPLLTISQHFAQAPEFTTRYGNL